MCSKWNEPVNLMVSLVYIYIPNVEYKIFRFKFFAKLNTVPKLWALFKVSSRMIWLPKNDHFRRNSLEKSFNFSSFSSFSKLFKIHTKNKYGTTDFQIMYHKNESNFIKATDMLTLRHWSTRLLAHSAYWSMLACCSRSWVNCWRTDWQNWLDFTNIFFSSWSTPKICWIWQIAF